MSALALRAAIKTAVDNPEQVIQRIVKDPLTSKQRAQTSAFNVICSAIAAMPAQSNNQKIIEFQTAFEQKTLATSVLTALNTVRGKKASECPTRATLFRWLTNFEKYQSGNRQALLKQYKGRPRVMHGWESKAIELFNTPSKPAYADVAYWLRTEFNFKSATKDRVTAYLKNLPQTLGKQSPSRMGQQFYKHNLSPYTIRDNDVLPVGFGYEGDGHTVDAYVAHPATGNLYRPELTIWIDVSSRYVTGWYLTDDESAISTLFALSYAITSQDHVPAMLFLDNGSGFKARMMTAETEGFFSRLSITPSYSLPGNSKGKGLVEGFFKIFRNRHDKKFSTYCGDDMAPEINRRLVEHVKNGKRALPSYTEYVASVRQYIEDYNNEPKAVLGGKSPREVWEAGLQQVPVHITADALVMPRRIRTVKKWRIRLDNRHYQDAALAHYNNQEVLVEYSLHNDAEIRVLDSEERLICVAYLVSKVARLPDSRIVEAEQKRTTGQIKRLELKAGEARLRGKPVISLEESNQILLDINQFSKANKVSSNFNPEDALFLGKKKAVDYDLDSLDSL